MIQPSESVQFTPGVSPGSLGEEYKRGKPEVALTRQMTPKGSADHLMIIGSYAGELIPSKKT